MWSLCFNDEARDNVPHRERRQSFYYLKNSRQKGHLYCPKKRDKRENVFTVQRTKTKETEIDSGGDYYYPPTHACSYPQFGLRNERKSPPPHTHTKIPELFNSPEILNSCYYQNNHVLTALKNLYIYINPYKIWSNYRPTISSKV